MVVSPDNRYVFAPDLGLDKIFIYKIDLAKQTITPNDPAYVDGETGAGAAAFRLWREWQVCLRGVRDGSELW